MSALRLPEGSTATCRFCDEPILLDQREGGGDGMDWGADPVDWTGNGGTGMDYGCSDSPDTDEEASGGHSPIFETVELPAGCTFAGYIWNGPRP